MLFNRRACGCGMPPMQMPMPMMPYDGGCGCGGGCGCNECCNSCPCDPIIEPCIEKCVRREFCHEVNHICPIHTRVINNHIVRHTYAPQFTQSEENVVTQIDPGSCCNFV